MVIKFEYESYDNCYEPGSVHEIKGESLRDVHISYDGGRLYVSINNIEVLGTALAGNSFSINVEQKNDS